ncbi:MAG: hypothetical protein JXN10_03595 [Clostridia bacterium]|nr:hypothetical protein [Clostridia bacterium]MBN2882587.1 hypothetical protein [Clostridia bacterium]
MKKSLVILVVMALLLSLALPVFAAKPEIAPGQVVKAEVQERIMIAREERLEFKKDKDNGAVFYDFYLSGDVMPVPPYGSLDIEDSDTMSKLIVNKPNGTNAVTVTGVMKGLLPETEYMVYISNGYDPYYVTEWSRYLNEVLIPEFTFMTDEEGHASWHANIPCEAVECIEGSFEFSVWINSVVPSGTLLISESITVECEE